MFPVTNLHVEDVPDGLVVEGEDALKDDDVGTVHWNRLTLTPTSKQGQMKDRERERDRDREIDR